MSDSPIATIRERIKKLSHEQIKDSFIFFKCSFDEVMDETVNTYEDFKKKCGFDAISCCQVLSNLLRALTKLEQEIEEQK